MAADSARAGHDVTTDDATFAGIARYDWVTTPYADVLHELAVLDDPAQAEKEWGGSGRTGCGVWSVWLRIPGLFARMGAPRCKRCCDRAGLPQGVGSPKNDPELRARVGLNG